MLLRIVVALLAGLGLSVAFEPVAAPVVLPFALAAFALTTRGLRVRVAWLPGLVFGAGFFIAHLAWLRTSIGADAWIALSGFEALFYALLGAASPVLQRLPAWPAWLAGAWVTMEVARGSWPFGGLPWGRIGFSVVDTPVAPALAYVGVDGVGFLLAAVGFLLAALVVAARGTPRLLAGAALVAVAAVTVTPAVVPYTLPTTGQTTVAAVQGDVPGAGNDILADFRQVTDNHVEATVDLADAVRRGERPAPDFVVWPENSTAVDPFDDASTNAGIERAVGAVGVPVLVGGIVDAGEEHVLNQGIVWDPETGPGERYTKRHPVPYGEYIPFRDLVSGAFGRLAVVPRDMLSGTRETPLRIAGVDVADSICFDIAYDDGLLDQVERGAEMLTVQTSNASFIFTDQIDQQFAITRLRAIETGRPVVVAATNGVSGIIAPDGSVLAVTESRTQDVLVDTVDLKTGMTPGLRVGAVLSLLLPASTAVGLLGGLLAYRRRAGGATPQNTPGSTAGSTPSSTAGSTAGSTDNSTADTDRQDER